MKRDFPTAVIVSVCQNRLVCPFDKYRDFLDFMTGASIPLWDVERARVAVAKRLENQYSILGKVPAPPEKTDSGNAGKYVRACSKAAACEQWTVDGGKVKFAVRTGAAALK